MNEFDENNILPVGENAPEASPEAVTADVPAPTEASAFDPAPLSGVEAADDAPEVGETAPDAPQPEADSAPAASTAVPVYTAPAYTAPQPPKRKRNTGLIVFAIIMVVAVVAAAVIAGACLLIDSVNDFLPENPIDVEDLTPEHETDLSDRPDDLEEGTPSYVYYETVDSVVLIQVYNMEEGAVLSEGSGVIYSADGYIVTNDHVYSEVPDPQFLITLADGRQFDAQFVAGDARTDLAVLKIDATDLKPADFGNSDQCLVGETVITIGNPGGSALTFSMTEGVISAVDRWATNSSTYAMRYIQIDAAINSGNSGGALVNMYGQVIGIPSRKYVGDNFENVGFCIPADTVVRTCDSLISYGYVANRAKLGVTYQEVDAVSAKVSGMASTGLLLSQVTEGTPIAQAGVQAGDLITHINGEKITESIIVLAVLEDCAPGDTVKLTVLRPDGRTFDVEVELLEDRGSSSYTQGGDAESDLPENGGEFNFPEGE